MYSMERFRNPAATPCLTIGLLSQGSCSCVSGLVILARHPDTSRVWSMSRELVVSLQPFVRNLERCHLSRCFLVRPISYIVNGGLVVAVKLHDFLPCCYLMSDKS